MKHAAALLAVFAVSLSSTACAEDTSAELIPFVEKGTSLLDFAAADLNGDNLSDYVFILEQQDFKESFGQRTLKIAVRGSDGKLKIVKVNDRIIQCSECGGIYGDPFVGIEAGRNTFTVKHYGGSAWRWGSMYEFKYSRLDKTWQLTLIESTWYHITDQENAENRKFRPPKDYGKIDIADFDPDQW